MDTVELIHFVPTTLFKMCVNVSRTCATVKIISHVPIISHSSRNMKTKKFMRATFVLVRIKKKLLIRKHKTRNDGAAAVITVTFWHYGKRHALSQSLFTA